MDDDTIKSQLLAAYTRADDGLRAEFARSLPLGDAMDDRWDRARRLGFDEGASIYNSAMVLEPVSVGANSWIGPNTLLDGSGGGLVIGHHCSISAGVQIYTHDTVNWALSGGKAPARKAPVEIGDCTYIGSQSIITAGVTIGDHCVIAANSVVKTDVSSHTIVGGSPARVLGRVRIEGDDIHLEYSHAGGDS